MMCTKPTGGRRRLRALVLGPAMIAALAAVNIPAVSSAIESASSVRLTPTVSEAKGSEKNAKAQEAQTVVVAPVKEESSTATTAPGNEQLPQYPGGEHELYHFMAMNIKYPQEAIDKKEEGRVVVSFIVNPDGRVSDAKVLRSVSPTLDAEALRIAGSMPRWEPGRRDGKAVRCTYAMPITFKLSGNEKKTSSTADENHPDGVKNDKLEEVKVIAYTGESSANPENKPTIFIDGKVYDGKTEDIDKNNIESITVKKDDPAYPNGIINITMKK